MADKTTGNLQLNKPANGEYQDNWDEPINENADILDEHISALEDEIKSAQGSAGSLTERLDTGLDEYGNVKPIPEVQKSWNSQLTGRYTDLYNRLNALDQELAALRFQRDTLLDGATYLGKDFRYCKAISGPVGSNNAANFLTAAGSVFTVEGDPTPIVINIGGYVSVVRIDVPIDLSGQSAGTKYIYAQRNTNGRVVEDSLDSGVTGGDNLNEFSDPTANFISKKVQKGDRLIISSGVNADMYLVESVTDETHLLIKGKFVSAIGAQAYEIKDMLHPTISYETSKVPSDSKTYLGECEFSTGGTITSITTYAYRGEFESDWISIDVSTSPTFTQSFNHNLGFLPKSITIYASQVNDESLPSEILSVADVASDYNIGFDAGTGDASVSPTGGPYMTRSVKVKATRKTLTISNVRDNVFYKDYDGTVQDTGYIKVVARG